MGALETDVLRCLWASESSLTPAEVGERLGTGLAYGIKYQGLKGAAMAFMGDGAVNQGAVHEAYNLAALWKLPVVFVIENNGYSMGTSQAR